MQHKQKTKQNKTKNPRTAQPDTTTRGKQKTQKAEATARVKKLPSSYICPPATISHNRNIRCTKHNTVLCRVPASVRLPHLLTQHKDMGVGGPEGVCPSLQIRRKVPPPIGPAILRPQRPGHKTSHSVLAASNQSGIRPIGGVTACLQHGGCAFALRRRRARKYCIA